MNSSQTLPFSLNMGATLPHFCKLPPEMGVSEPDTHLAWPSGTISSACVDGKDDNADDDYCNNNGNFVLDLNVPPPRKMRRKKPQTDSSQSTLSPSELKNTASRFHNVLGI
jgi:hypothetical protein